MHSGDQNDTKRKKSKLKTFFIVLIILVFLALMFLAAVPAYISSDSGTNLVLNKVNNKINGKLSLTDLNMGWFKGIEMQEISFRDEAGTANVQIDNLSTRPGYFALLGGNIVLNDTVIKKPEIVIELNEQMISAARSPTEEKPEPRAGKKPMTVPLSNLELEVIDGNIEIVMPPSAGGQKLEMRNITSKVDLNKPGTQSVIEMSMQVAGAGRESEIKADGKITPGKGWSLKGTTGNFDIKVDKLQLESLKPLLALAGKDMDLKGMLDAEGQFDIDDGVVKELKAQAKLDGFEHTAKGVTTKLEEPVTLNAKVASEGKKIQIDSLDINSSFCKLECRGTAETIRYDLDADIEKTYAVAKPFIKNQEIQPAGSLTAAGTFKAEDKTYSASGSGTVGNLTLTKNGKKTPQLRADIAYDATIDNAAKLIKIKSASATSDHFSANINDTRIATDPTAKEKIQMQLDGAANLAEAKKYAAVFTELPAGMVLEGNLETDMNLSLETEALHIQTDNTTIDNLKVGKQGMEPYTEKLVIIKADIIASGPEKKDLEIKDLQIDSSKIDITKTKLSKTSRNGKTTVDGQLEAEYDLQAVSAAASSVLPEGLIMKGKRKDTIDLNSTYPTEQKNGFAANLNAETDIGFDSASYMGLNVAKTETKVSIEKGKLDIEPFETTVNKGKFRFGAKADFNEKPAMLRVNTPVRMAEKIEITDEMTNKLLKYINPIFAKQVGVDGTVDFNCDKMLIPLASGQKRAIDIAGTIWMERVSMQPRGLMGVLSNTGELEMLPTDFVLRNGTVRYDDMQINVGDNPVNFGGAISIMPDKKLDMTVMMPWTVAGRTVNVGDVSREGRIQVGLEGTVDNPKLNTQSIIEELGKQLLREKLGGLRKGGSNGGDNGQGGQGSEGSAEDLLKEKLREEIEKIFQ